MGSQEGIPEKKESNTLCDFFVSFVFFEVVESVHFGNDFFFLLVELDDLVNIVDEVDCCNGFFVLVE